MFSDTTTVITTRQGKLYVAGILDLYGDMPVGIAMSTHNDKKLIMDAFDDMMIMRGCGKLAVSFTRIEAPPIVRMNTGRRSVSTIFFAA